MIISYFSRLAMSRAGWETVEDAGNKVELLHGILKKSGWANTDNRQEYYVTTAQTSG